MTVGARSTGPGDEPMVARWGSPHPAAPLVVVLHGNGTSEHSMIEIRRGCRTGPWRTWPCGIRDLGREGPAVIGPAGTRSVFLDGPADPATLVHPAERELAHLHPDGSLHLALPDALAYDALGKGWALAHPLAGVRLAAGLVLVPAPRDEAEVEVVAAVVTAAHRAATGG
ncbi:hypothetical protein GCM10023215_37250 [Pseudonocardia yuanmonensis]|uniref:Luciferase domain-containing protein n=1 Tax=Pseudonocardia yuanmonensis TaxID=1095914 RepID=A0ABP8WVY1_9PSEU